MCAFVPDEVVGGSMSNPSKSCTTRNLLFIFSTVALTALFSGCASVDYVGDAEVYSCSKRLLVVLFVTGMAMVLLAKVLREEIDNIESNSVREYGESLDEVLTHFFRYVVSQIFSRRIFRPFLVYIRLACIFVGYLFVLGSIVLFIYLPGTTIALHPDKVVIDDDRTVLYSDIESVEKNKDSFRFKLADGSLELIEAGFIERAAFPNLLDMLEKYRSDNPIVAQNSSPNSRPATPSVAVSTPDLKLPPAKRMVEVMVVETQESTNDLPAAKNEPSIAHRQPAPSVAPMASPVPAKMRYVKQRKINISVPAGWSVLQPDTPLFPNAKLQACWASAWSPITVVEVHDDGAVKVKWDDWGSVYDMTREDLVISSDELQEMQRQDEFTSPSQRVWIDKSGDFKITATYVTSTSEYVVLRKQDGSEVSVLISKLSGEDQRKIRQYKSP